jgi:hypothetical protein
MRTGQRFSPAPGRADAQDRDPACGVIPPTGAHAVRAAASRHKEQRASRWIDPMQERSVAWNAIARA